MTNGSCRGVDGLEKVIPFRTLPFLVSMFDFCDVIPIGSMGLVQKTHEHHKNQPSR